MGSLMECREVLTVVLPLLCSRMLHMLNVLPCKILAAELIIHMLCRLAWSWILPIPQDSMMRA